MTSWALETDRTDITRTQVVETAPPEPGPGEAVLRVDRVGVTANNVTYAVLGESFRYWQFFPASDPARGRVPLWGFADVAASQADGVEVGQRVYGYLPPAGELLVRPERPGAQGFRDASEHRTDLPSPYNAYALVSGDPAYDVEREDLQVLYRPLFVTSFVLADSLAGDGAGGARTLVLSSASSKTAYGTAFLLQDADVEVVGLTSAGNREFTESLGCYDRVLAYDDLDDLDPELATGYVDVAGSTPLRESLHRHLAGSLVLDLIVGVTHQDGSRPGDLQGARPTAFFAPDRIRQRTQEWGRDGFDARFGDAWRAFAPMAERNVDVVVSQGAEGLQRAWAEVAGGTSDPRVGHVIAL